MLSLLKMWGALPPPRTPGLRQRGGGWDRPRGSRGRSARRARLPPASPGRGEGGHSARPTAGTCSLVPGGGLPAIYRSLPPLLFGVISLQRARRRGAFLGWKFPVDPRLENKGILRSKKQPTGNYFPPPALFLNEITPK